VKIIRSTKCSLKFCTARKREELQKVISEYGRVVNVFIDHFWANGTVEKAKLLKPIVDLPETWLSFSLRQLAAREALDLIKSTKEVISSNKEQIKLSISAISGKIETIKPTTRANRRRINNLHCRLKKNKMKLDMMQPRKPKHRGKRMPVSSLVAKLQKPKAETKEFDLWLHLANVGSKIKLDLPIKLHKHFKDLEAEGERINSYIITKDYVQLCFERETGPKKEVNSLIGIDTGINALASLSTGEQLGTDISEIIARVKRCKWGSKGRKRAANTLRQRICEVAKQVTKRADLVVVEKLKNLNNHSKFKGRLSKNIRSSIGSWNYSYWLRRLEMCCEVNRVSFRTVSPSYTSQKCSKCGDVDRTNRIGEKFKCQNCNHTGNADINAALNILERFVTGKYGSCYKLLCL
jgi:IS605 OrfB family transposase